MPALLQLPETEVLRKALARVEGQVAALPEDAPDSVRRRGEATVEDGRAAVARGEMRDEIQAKRSPGCWCLGLGGRGVRYIPCLDADPIPVLEEYCDCPEGTARRATDTVERTHYESRRRLHRAQALFSKADVPPRFAASTIDSYPISLQTRDGFTAIRKWAKDGRESLLIYGPYGTGKTSLAVAAMRERVQEDHVDALFLTTPELLERIRATYEPRPRRDDTDASEADVLGAVRHSGLLVLDDLGAERPTEWVQEKLFTIVNHRHDDMVPTIFTSNLDPEGLAKHLGERITWRIVEMCTVVKLDGPNLRDRKGV